MVRESCVTDNTVVLLPTLPQEQSLRPRHVGKVLSTHLKKTPTVFAIGDEMKPVRILPTFPPKSETHPNPKVRKHLL